MCDRSLLFRRRPGCAGPRRHVAPTAGHAITEAHLANHPQCAGGIHAAGSHEPAVQGHVAAGDTPSNIGELPVSSIHDLRGGGTLEVLGGKREVLGQREFDRATPQPPGPTGSRWNHMFHGYQRVTRVAGYESTSAVP